MDAIDFAILWLMLFPNAVCTFLVARWLWRKGMPATEYPVRPPYRPAPAERWHGHNGPPTHPRPAPPPCPPPRNYDGRNGNGYQPLPTDRQGTPPGER